MCSSDLAVKSCSQGGVRGGAATLFYPMWHLEVESLLVLKNNRGVEGNRVRHMDYGVQINKLMYTRLLKGEDITLFSPSDVPGLYDAFFAAQGAFPDALTHDAFFVEQGEGYAYMLSDSGELMYSATVRGARALANGQVQLTVALNRADAVDDGESVFMTCAVVLRPDADAPYGYTIVSVQPV